MATHNLESVAYISIPLIPILNDTIIITDGAYLFKPSCSPHWNMKIYLKTDFTTAELRGVIRDANALGGVEVTKVLFKSRYHRASKMYIDENHPEQLADFVIDNTDFDNLSILTIPIK